MKIIGIFFAILLIFCFVLGCGGYQLRGKVSSDEGQPLGGATIEAKDMDNPEKAYTTKTKEDGSYAISGLKAGNYSISVKHVDYIETPEEEKLILQNEKIPDYKLHRKVSIQGRVLDGDEKTPISGATVVLEPQFTTKDLRIKPVIRQEALERDERDVSENPEIRIAEGSNSYRAETDLNGNFEFKDLPCGRYKASVFKDIRIGQKEFNLDPNSNKITIILSPGGDVGTSYFEIKTEIIGPSGIRPK